MACSGLACRVSSVRKCWARGGWVKTATRSFSPAKQIVLLSSCGRCRGKCLVKGGFEDTSNWSYLCV